MINFLTVKSIVFGRLEKIILHVYVNRYFRQRAIQATDFSRGKRWKKYRVKFSFVTSSMTYNVVYNVVFVLSKSDIRIAPLIFFLKFLSFKFWSVQYFLKHLITKFNTHVAYCFRMTLYDSRDLREIKFDLVRLFWKTPTPRIIHYYRQYLNWHTHLFEIMRASIASF